MSRSKQVDISVVRKEATAFWVAGNEPTQTSFGLGVEEVMLHLKVLYLLTDRIIAAGSYYFESSITRQITRKLKRLFEEGEIIYFVDALVEDFSEHGASKIENSPTGLTSYNDKDIVKKRAKELDSLGYILKRPSCSISDKIIEIWIRDINSDVIGTLGYLLINFIPSKFEREDLISKLTGIANNRGKENFVWEYLRPKLHELKLPEKFISSCQQRLSSIYAVATSEMLEVPIDQNELGFLSPFITPESTFDSGIFLHCMEILGVKESIKKIEIPELIKLKNSIEFIVFREFYFILIETVGLRKEEIKEWLLNYKQLSESFSIKRVTVKEFLMVFTELCKSLKKKDTKYNRPLEVLLHRYELTNKLSIDGFIDKLTILDNLTERKYKKIMRDKVFVIYGRNNKIVESLFSFLRALDLKPMEWEQACILTGKATPSTYEIVKAGLVEADAVIVLFTGDDLAFIRKELLQKGEIEEKPSPQPRSNVILEAGLSFGMKPEKTIIIEIGKLRKISDFDGFNTIRLDNSPEMRNKLVSRLSTLCETNSTGNHWLKVGDFS